MQFDEMTKQRADEHNSIDSAVQSHSFSNTSKLEKEWKNRIYDKLLKVMDLSLIDNLEPNEAKIQIREICQQLIQQESIPCNQATRHQIIKRIEALAIDPRPAGCEKLTGQEFYRIRQGNYRIVYSIQDDELTVWVVKISHRKDIYKRL